MDMKKLIESMDHIELEGGMPMVPSVPPMAPEDKGNPVTMNVSMNASGKDHVADLLDMMKNAGMAGAEEVADAGLPMRTDMERLRGIVDGPEDMDASSCNDDIDIDDEAVAEYENEPDEEYKAIDDVINSGDDLHRSKDAYAATQDGDNPMAVEDGDEATTYSVKGKSAEAQAALADAAGNIKEKLAARLKELMADGYNEDEDEAFREAKDSFDEAGCKSEMKRLDASGCSKNEMLKKVGAKFGCGKGKFEELYASSCGSH
tara:strand:- start:516 stop:1298 length:783 start_codon:yes stop_codon:yes gene_type:complete